MCNACFSYFDIFLIIHSGSIPYYPPPPHPPTQSRNELLSAKNTFVWYLKCEKKTELVVYELFELITKKSKWGVVCVCLWVYKVIVQYHLDHDKMKCNITTDLCCKYCPSHSVSLWRGHPQFKLYQNQIFGSFKQHSLQILLPLSSKE